ncbi:MAG: HAD-superfamily hydrolase, subfamily [Firmicutes bacterium]|nr:HAD-superfamily hydrolase, subfamily [Bacillota bacterium]
MSALADIQLFLLDMDGTVYLGNRLLPGSLDFLNYLDETGRDHLFLTNNSSRNAGHYAQKLTKLGWSAQPGEILTSGEATALYLGGEKPASRIYLLGTPDLEAEFVSHGFVLTDENPDYVVLGFDMTLTYAKLVRACDLIRAGVPFVATHPDINCPTETGYIPDCGAMTALITSSTGVAPKVIGKPNREIIDAMFRKKPVRREQVAMVGDRLYTDIVMGHNAGVTSVLVLSGEAKEADIPLAPAKPDYVVAGLGALHDALKQADAIGKETCSRK